MRAVPVNAIELASPQSIAGNMPSASDVAPDGYAIDRATTRQRKTGRPVQFELTELTRGRLWTITFVSQASSQGSICSRAVEAPIDH